MIGLTSTNVGITEPLLTSDFYGQAQQEEIASPEVTVRMPLNAQRSSYGMTESAQRGYNEHFWLKLEFAFGALCFTVSTAAAILSSIQAVKDIKNTDTHKRVAKITLEILGAVIFPVLSAACAYKMNRIWAKL